ncbi:MAG: DUF2752 domain-containing protein [Ignavibacteria bacterium]|nr:DUF2752 domain-containing protein [Ignavibacteria bacterium]
MLQSNKYFVVEPASPSSARNTIWLLVVIAAVGLINVYLNPLEHFFTDVLHIPSVNGCPLYTLSGVPCPMCGMGRVFSCMTDFYIAESFYYNPLGLVFYLIFGFVYIFIFFLSLRRKKIVLKPAGVKLWYIPVIFLIIMWVLNILFGHHHN